jgi:hypothetical protein
MLFRFSPRRKVENGFSTLLAQVLRKSGDYFSYFLSKFQNFLGWELPAKKYAVQ